MTGSILNLSRLFVFASALCSCNPKAHDTFVCGVGEQKFKYLSRENVFEIFQGVDDFTNRNFVAFKSGNMSTYSIADSKIERDIYYISNFFYINTGSERNADFENLACKTGIEIDGTSQVNCRNDELGKNVEINWSKKNGIQYFVEKYDSGETIEYRLVGNVGVARLCEVGLR